MSYSIPIFSIGSNPCSSNPCQNGGTCSVDGDGEYECDCAEEFDGDRCEERMLIEMNIYTSVLNEYALLDCKYCPVAAMTTELRKSNPGENFFKTTELRNFFQICLLDVANLLQKSDVT